MKPSEIKSTSNIIDVLSDSSYAEEHIKGAKNFCVYEIAFKDKVNKAFPQKDTELILYGYTDATEEAGRAAYILKNDGYTDVHILEGGLKGWKEAGKETVKGPGVKQLDGIAKVDIKESRVEWTGRNIGNKHSGGISIKEGTFEFKEGNLTSGSLVMDMDSITNFDLPDAYKGSLVGHLKSDDFFSVSKYPTAKILFKAAKNVPGPVSTPNLEIIADLTIKDTTKEITFPAFLHQKEGKAVLNAHMDIDRSEWDVKYGSEKFFSRLGIHLIDDTVSFEVIIVADFH